MGRRIEARGAVQGVGFRPWVWRLAHELGVVGRVHNHAAGVTVDAFGSEGALDALLERMRASPPPAARVDALTWTPIDDEALNDFVIVPSAPGGARRAAIPPDLATCSACRAEVFDPADRRFRYPFTNCTDCGPRFTIAWDVPYDRPATSMAGFRMCAACQREYDDPRDRRFHAQPNACPACGPRLALWNADGAPVDGDALDGASAWLRSGRIVAVHGLGGFHLACDATDAVAVETLRARKRRENKPFAVMVADLAAAERTAALDEAGRGWLARAERPIVLAPWRDRTTLAPGVAPDAPMIGLFLPYTPLHHLLLAAVGRPLVMTSANISGEPIVRDPEEARERLRGLVDGYLVHDRPITTRTDDSVVAIHPRGPVLVRRSRGFVPRPIPSPVRFAEVVLAVGGDLKNTCAIGLGDEVFLGPHVGDVSTVAGYDALAEAISRMERFLGVSAEVVAHDLHPGYLSTRWAHARGGRTVAVQHHHAHAVGALAALGHTAGVAVVYDGTGYGTDGTAWGAEVLRVRPGGYERLATWRPLALPGGDRAIHEPWRIVLGWLRDAGLPEVSPGPSVDPALVAAVGRQLAANVNTPFARGMGRRFDAIASLALGRPRATFEGELAIALEGAARGDGEPYPWRVATDVVPWEVDDRPALASAVDDLAGGEPVARVAARFHATVIAATATLIDALAAPGEPVALAGGCFVNARLADGLLARCAAARLPAAIPPGDGGLAFGQAIVAAGRDTLG